VIAALLIIILWQARGGVWLSRKMGFLTPASSEWVELVEELAREMKMEKLPGVWVANTAMFNAFAFTTGHAVIFTQPLLDSLPREQIRALTAHEIGHLKEGAGSHFLRLIHPLVYLPIICLNPLIGSFDFALGLVIALGGYLLATRLYMKFLQKAEFAADAAGPEECEETNRDLAEALTTLYRENLVPAVLPKSGLKTHPDLYDRLLALGADPDFQRPQSPSSAHATGFAILATFACGLILIVLQILIWSISGFG
jgi:Zn-dependent protease with chaperone function